MANAVSAAEVWLGRDAVRSAQRDRETEAWLPKGSLLPLPDQPEDEEKDDSTLWTITSEKAGVGSMSNEEDSFMDGILRRRNQSTDKLLEQLLGKKAADAKKKSRASAKSNIALNHATPKALDPASVAKSTPVDDDESGDEGGRSAAFTSKRKTRDNERPAYVASGDQLPKVIDPDAEPPDSRENDATLRAMVTQTDQAKQRPNDSKDDQRPRKKKPTSYLDEMLAKKTKKKKGEGKT